MKKQKNKILITGAAGFIGSHLVELLLKEGIEVSQLRLLVFPNESLGNLPQKKFDIVYGDICDLKTVRRAVKGVNIIYHLAAETRAGEGKYLKVNYEGTKNLITACNGQSIKKFVFFSTIAVYGLPAFVGDRTNVTESSKKMIFGEYALSKFKAELEVIKAHKKWGLPYVIVRPTTVYGPRDKAGMFQLVQAIQKGYFFRIGRGDNQVDYVHVSDVVKGARLAQLSHKKSGDYILGAKKPVAFNQIIAPVYSQVGKEMPSWYIPRPVALVISYLISALNHVVGTNIPISPDRVRVMTSSYYFNSLKAIKELNYNPKS